ncbi:MAG: ribose-5-phosphate isomerase RpiA [Candidatus Caldarchaeum sp.]|nr:ribose-5-phosphate isomerase RpiA [Candidatus Caldarchaeum sp.]
MKAKKIAAEQAVAHVVDGFVVGIGSGSTVSLIIEELAKTAPKVKVVAASWQSHYECVKSGLSVISFEQAPHPDIYLDSFDQATREGHMIKGGGGAMLREKVLASASRRKVFVGESGKLVEKLFRPVPVEITPFAYPYVTEKLTDLGAQVVLRTSTAKNGPIISDNCNFIADADFGPIPDPVSLEKKLRNIPGLVENGLFISLADEIIIVDEDGKIHKQTYR